VSTLVPIAIIIVCLLAGIFACKRWLPRLPAGPIGNMAFVVVCGLLTAIVVGVGLHIYHLVVTLSQPGDGLEESNQYRNAEVVAGTLGGIVVDVAELAALAALVYGVALLAIGIKKPVEVPQPGTEPTQGNV